MAKKRKLKRIGKRVSDVEETFAGLSKPHRTAEVLLALAKVGGISLDAARERFRVALALMEGRKVELHERSSRDIEVTS